MSLVAKFSDTTGMSLWADGVLIASNADVQDVDLVPPAGTSNIYLGAGFDGSSAFANIIVEDFEIYNELTDAKCLELSNV